MSLSNLFQLNLLGRASMSVVTCSLGLTLALFPSCARTVTFDQPSQIKEVPIKVKAKLDPALVALKEKSSAFGGAESGIYDVGKAMRYFFEHDADAPIALSYVTSSLDHQQRFVDTLLFVTMAGVDAEYTITVTLDTNSGARQLVEAKGKGYSFQSSYTAYQEAIEKALNVLYQKLLALTTAR